MSISIFHGNFLKIDVFSGWFLLEVPISQITKTAPATRWEAGVDEV